MPGKVMERIRQGAKALRDKNLHVWTAGYARWAARATAGRAAAALRREPARGPRHLLFAFCDHYEPLWKTKDRGVGAARVRAWSEGYPALTADFRDSDGRAPRHSFFFPGEEYEPGYLDALAELARRGLGEVELHLHHDGDTAENLRRTIGGYLGLFAKHGHLTHGADGRPR